MDSIIEEYELPGWTIKHYGYSSLVAFRIGVVVIDGIALGDSWRS
jgi:hypothetical protein